jgi:hypothetical protein
MGAVGEEGEPRESDSATSRKEAPEGALRILQCVVGIPSAVRLFLPLYWHPVPSNCFLSG